MGFKEWNLDLALYYGGFNFITLFHFQYSTLDFIIFGYNNILMIFVMCVKLTLSSI
jgi:hypothetical protein